MRKNDDEDEDDNESIDLQILKMSFDPIQAIITADN